MCKVLGLILELNPFHNGHHYFLRETKAKLNPDLTIAVISGNYTMRGDISVLDKFTKTSLLLVSGIDIVLELPFISTVNSADYFAANAVNILNEFGVTDLGFGVELDNFNQLNQMKTIIDNPKFDHMVRHYLNKGHSYPASCFQALKQLNNNQEIIENFTLPNNTLANQYLRSIERLQRKINITLIKRIDSNYFDEKTTGKISSATAIRGLLRDNKDITAYIPDFCREAPLVDLNKAENNLLLLLKYRFIQEKSEYFQNIFGISEGIENRFAAFLENETCYQKFIKNIQTKRYTANKIKRLILHVLLDTDKKYEETCQYYLRLLGSNQKGLAYIRNLPKTIKDKIITSFKNRTDEISTTELRASRLYDLITGKTSADNEFKIPIIGGKHEYENN